MKKGLDTLASLQAMGFSDKEARTYLASLELGPATVAEIAAQAKLTRPSVYLMIESLTRRGMMATYKVGKKSMYRAGNPVSIKFINAQARTALVKKELAVNSIIKSLSSVTVNNKDIAVSFVSGEEATALIRHGELSTKTLTREILNLKRTRQAIPPPYDGDARLDVIAKDNYKSVCQESHGYTLSGASKARASRIGREIKGAIELIDDALYIDYLLDISKTLIIRNEAFSQTIRSIFDAIFDESQILSK